MTLQYIAVVVTEQDILHGEERNCKFCPIALAIRRIIKRNCFNSVQPGLLNLFDRETSDLYTVRLPYVAREFIGLFDTGTRYFNIPELHFELLVSDKYIMLPIINNMVGV